MVKETCVPAGSAKLLFLSAPLIGLAATTVASTIIWCSLLFGQQFVGDLIVVLYLLTMPALAVVLGSFASRNPLASVGGSREMKLVFSYELPFVLSVCVPIIKAGSIRLDRILAEGAAVLSVSGIVALVVSILCMQAKLTLIPFDMPEAETELSGGAYVEYSGPPLGIFKLTRAMMLFTMPTFLVAVFCGGWSLNGLGFVLWYVGLVVIVVLIRNTAPRVRIDQAVRFFWGPVTVAALVAVTLALLGW
jgi:NADH-quinone oxidoreductase subunit H